MPVLDGYRLIAQLAMLRQTLEASEMEKRMRELEAVSEVLVRCWNLCRSGAHWRRALVGVASIPHRLPIIGAVRYPHVPRKG